jgi:4,5-DOPA dioxygenase extradiol
MHLFPEAHIPIFSLSIDSRDSLEENFKLGEKLRILRDHEILIITNGNIVHNLGVVDFNLGTNIPHTFARDFDMEFKVALDNRDYRALFNPYILK